MATKSTFKKVHIECWIPKKLDARRSNTVLEFLGQCSLPEYGISHRFHPHEEYMNDPLYKNRKVLMQRLSIRGDEYISISLLNIFHSYLREICVIDRFVVIDKISGKYLIDK